MVWLFLCLLFVLLAVFCSELVVVQFLFPSFLCRLLIGVFVFFLSVMLEIFFYFGGMCLVVHFLFQSPCI